MEKRGITKQRLLDLKKTVKEAILQINKLQFEMFDELGKDLEDVLRKLNYTIEKNTQLVDFKGLTDKEKQELESGMTPELYYNFKMFDKGIAIVRTNWWFDTETQCRYQSRNKYHYSIKYYKCYSDLFKDKRTRLENVYDNTVYGQFETLEEAIPYFRRAIADILIKYGKCNALNPLDFF